MSGPNQSAAGTEHDPAVAAREISRLYGEMWRRFQPPRRSIEGSDVTPRMLGLLRHLEGSGPLTVGEQAVHLGIGRAAASELIDRLESKGLVERMRDQRDQRRVFVWLTDEGRRRVASLAGSVLDPPFLHAVAAISPEQRRHIIDGLEALLRAAGTSTAEDELPPQPPRGPVGGNAEENVS
jgi:DNA-binding MarR family transcriptional regulator